MVMAAWKQSVVRRKRIAFRYVLVRMSLGRQLPAESMVQARDATRCASSSATVTVRYRLRKYRRRISRIIATLLKFARYSRASPHKAFTMSTLAASAPETAIPASSDESKAEKKIQPLTMQIVVRRDLYDVRVRSHLSE